MTKSGLFQTSNNYASIRKLFHLAVEDVNEHAPNDISYVYSGYAPLSVRMIQKMIKRESLEDFSSIPGEFIHELPDLSNISVLYVGGCTFAEISALRHLSTETSVKINVLTTHIINGNSLMHELIE